MTFTNITPAGIYMQCCHREVEPGGSFIVPWLAARNNRALRLAMASGALTWRSDDGEPHVPGSPDEAAARRVEAEAAKRAESEAAKRAEAEATARQMAADDAAVKDNMARMGHFDVPSVGAYKVEARKVEAERPVTKDDVIDGDKPASLADIRRHNQAVKKMSAGGNGGKA